MAFRRQPRPPESTRRKPSRRLFPGISHVAHRNVDWRLFFRIVIPGVIGGVLGAYVLTQISAGTARPFVLAYLTALGLYLFYRGVMHKHTERQPKVVSPLGLVGGFLDAAGGGGWGAIVTSNLLVQGSNPRKTIGTVNTAEFFLTVTISATFIAALGWEAFTIATAGLLIGGVLAAPFGAMIAKRVNPDTLLTFVGVLVTVDQHLRAVPGADLRRSPHACVGLATDYRRPGTWRGQACRISSQCQLSGRVRREPSTSIQPPMRFAR